MNVFHVFHSFHHIKMRAVEITGTEDYASEAQRSRAVAVTKELTSSLFLWILEVLAALPDSNKVTHGGYFLS